MAAEEQARRMLSGVLDLPGEAIAAGQSAGIAKLDPEGVEALPAEERQVALTAFRAGVEAARETRALISDEVVAGVSGNDLDAGLRAAARALAARGAALSPEAQSMLATCGCDPFPPEAGGR